MMFLCSCVRITTLLLQTRVYNHCEKCCERGLSAQNSVLLFMQTDEYALEGTLGSPRAP